jgi:hypothetical protein
LSGIGCPEWPGVRKAGRRRIADADKLADGVELDHGHAIAISARIDVLIVVVRGDDKAVLTISFHVLVPS